MRRNLVRHVGVYGIVNGAHLFLGLGILTMTPWWVWILPALAWGIGLAIHALVALTASADDWREEHDERQQWLAERQQRHQERMAKLGARVPTPPPGVTAPASRRRPTAAWARTIRPMSSARLPNTVFASLGTTIFETMSRLAEAHGAINLGQGFPDEGGPAEVVERAVTFLREGNNQYPPMAGLPALREALARHEARHYGLTRDPKAEVLVTSGATEALAASLLAVVEPGDEVIVFEPLYDSYVPMILRAGGRPVPIRLRAPDFALDPAELRRAASPRTRAILVNDPQNPAAKAWARSELEAIAELARDADALVVCDEVYEHLVFDGLRHEPLATFPGMAERTLKIGSAGKIFSMTGWKVGWVTGPAPLLSVVAKAHQYLTFTTPPNLQAAVAWGLDHAGAWVAELTRTLQGKRDRFGAGLAAAGLRVLPSRGTYFLNVDLAGTPWAGRDLEYCRHLTEHRKVAAIPLSAFYVGDGPKDAARFCFAKRPSVLEEATQRLSA